MKAILIDPDNKTITEVDYNGDWQTIKTHIGNGCTTFTGGMKFGNDDMMMCDDEGLFMSGIPDEGRQNIGGIITGSMSGPLVGRVLLMGGDDEGETVDAKSEIIREADDFFTVDGERFMFIDKNAPLFNKYVAQFN